MVLDNIYYYKGFEYRAIEEVKMKDPVTREWVDAVQYRRRADRENIYVRERKDFLEKFESYSSRYGTIVHN
jgi:hypothetical protein